ncbi:coiled-coil domain-containing protein 6a isoform X1 [Electrophorus electricus]|uniref:Coiled-coil domain containing 6 n=1 Tax=Electrophorus electricus TaxID=8005 RepID=A0AAY5ERU5_ELEEL|nr:coiled-coil domain-containing protein 6a isoform X1 [Electrophorus electricus]
MSSFVNRVSTRVPDLNPSWGRWCKRMFLASAATPCCLHTASRLNLVFGLYVWEPLRLERARADPHRRSFPPERPFFCCFFCFLPSSPPNRDLSTPVPQSRSLLVATAMADSASESDTDGAGGGSAAPLSSSSSSSAAAASSSSAAGKQGVVISQFRLEELSNRLASLQQENKVLKIELETFKLKCKSLQEENRDLRKASVTIQARAEQEEEFISNTLFKKIQALQKEKETLAVNYEKEEEFLTNDLSRKLMQLQHEKAELEQHLEQEQEFQVNKLMKKIKKLENDTISKQLTLEQLRREKIDLENTLEQEQEALVNRLWKRMDKLEAEKRILQEKLDQPVSAPPSPREVSMEIDSPENMMRHIRFLKSEVERLKRSLRTTELQHTEKRAQYIEEERQMREENLRLQRKLQREMERREALCRQLSESESSLEMDDERYFNEMSAQGLRARTVSSPIPYTPSPSSSRPISPGLSYGSHTVGFTPPATLSRAPLPHYGPPGLHIHPGPSHGVQRPSPRRSNSPDKFKRPTPPPSPNMHAGLQHPTLAQPMAQSGSSPAAASHQPPAQP